VSGRSGYLPTLDGWRAIAIGMVMITHATDALFAPGAPHDAPTWYGLTRHGALGVDVFFGISGFLITSRLLEEHEQRRRISLPGFYIRRLCRIIPPYFVFLAALAALTVAGRIAIERPELSVSAFFVRNYFGLRPPSGWYTGHLWSLAVEEHFYLLWPTLLVLLTPRRARLGVVLLALAIAGWRVVEFRAGLLTRLLGPDVNFYLRTDIRFDALLWGCAAAFVYHDPGARATAARWLSAPGWIVLIGLFVAIVALHPPMAMAWQAMIIPCVLLGTVLHPQGAAGRFLETPPMRWVGRVSYSLYLWQQLFLLPWVLFPALPLGAMQRLPLNIAATVAAAAASYYLVERPMMKVGHRLAAPVTEGRA
jgi:peptidoglycan/LPS O-acetylase OafA/YrhL